jgi:hypothetical protein
MSALSPEISRHDILKAYTICGKVYDALDDLYCCVALSGPRLVQACFPGRQFIIENPPHYKLKTQFHDVRRYLEQHDSPAASSARHYLRHEADVMKRLESAMSIVSREQSGIGGLYDEVGFLCLMPRCIASPTLRPEGYRILQKWRNRESVNDCHELKEIVAQAEMVTDEVLRFIKELQDSGASLEDTSSEASVLRRRRT